VCEGLRERVLPMILWLCCVQEGIKSLIVHLVETYSSELESIDYVDTFQALKLKYDQVNRLFSHVLFNLVFRQYVWCTCFGGYFC